MAKHFINGQWLPAASGQTLPVINPATGETFDTLAAATPATSMTPWRPPARHCRAPGAA